MISLFPQLCVLFRLALAILLDILKLVKQLAVTVRGREYPLLFIARQLTNCIIQCQDHINCTHVH